MQKQQVLESMSHHMGRSGKAFDWEEAFELLGRIAVKAGKTQWLMVPYHVYFESSLLHVQVP